jgi:CheY-like chemotaxis protein
MTTSIPNLAFSQRIPPPIKKKRVLLVDSSGAKRDLRAEILRKLGMDVDCAADISEARTWWRADLYNLVLISAENEHGRRDKFCEDIRGATPPQRLAFLVGKPEYLADSPNPDTATPALGG